MFDLDAEALALSSVDEHGVEFSALDLVQHGLAGGSAKVAGGELLAGDEAIAQPPVDRVPADAELAWSSRP